MSSLEEAAAARKEKLLALRKRKAEAASGADSATAATETNEEPATKLARTEFKFRSYDPTTREAKKHDKLVDEQETVESATKDFAREAILADRARRAQELDLLNIQPKKPNWDLKRDLEKRLEKLRPKTQTAINTLIRQRLSAQKKGSAGTNAASGGEELSAAVGRRNIQHEDDDADDDDVL